MIDLAGLVDLVAEHRADLDLPVAPFTVGGVAHDTDTTPALMGIVNLSQDSWYRDSVAPSTTSAVRRGKVLAAQGAAFVDVGAESVDLTTARVGPADQVAALVPVIEELTTAGVVVSVESYEPEVVRASLVAGARILNLTGSTQDDAMFDLAAEHGASLVLCHVTGGHARDLDDAAVETDPLPQMLDQFAARVDNARSRGVDAGICVDPGIGFGYLRLDVAAERYRHQAVVLLNTFRLRRLGLPVCHALPSAFDIFEDQMRTAEGFFAVLASLGRTGIYRTHEVPHVSAVLTAMGMLSAKAP
ncbi:MAG: hypothetical protein JWO46_2650 [Nocardioidaceae bacterium]|nr:hypothetical protein [Nocardioidaceae bacterium]